MKTIVMWTLVIEILVILIAAPLDVVSKLNFSSICYLFFLEISDIVYLIEHPGTQGNATFIEMAYFDL